MQANGVLSILLTAILSACATVAKGPTYSEAKAFRPDPAHATIYIFREYAEPTAWGANIVINGSATAALNQGGFAWVYSKPGKTEIKAVWSSMSGQNDSFISIETRPGQTYYVELTGISKGEVKFPFLYFKVGSGLSQIKPDAAVKKLETCCRFQKPANDTI